MVASWPSVSVVGLIMCVFVLRLPIAFEPSTLFHHNGFDHMSFIVMFQRWSIGLLCEHIFAFVAASELRARLRKSKTGLRPLVISNWPFQSGFSVAVFLCVCGFICAFILSLFVLHLPVNILYKSIADRYRPVMVADGPITARYRFIKNASWALLGLVTRESSTSRLWLLLRIFTYIFTKFEQFYISLTSFSQAAHLGFLLVETTVSHRIFPH